MKTFEQLGLKSSLIEGLKKEGIHTPTPIQKETIPFILEHKDVIGQSKTGSGKTLAFLLPIIEKLDTDSKNLQAIILTPTHELAIQIQRQIESLSENASMPIRSIPIIGKANVKRQIEKLKEKPHIIVGSTGRINELINKKKIKPHTVKTIVIDEADRLLDKKNLQGINAVIKTTLRDRQLLLFSATMPESIIEVAQDIMKEPEVLKIQENETVNESIEHMYLFAERREKAKVLRQVISAVKPERAIVFINNSDEVETILEKLKFHHYKAAAIHGTRIKLDRKKAIDDFRKGNVSILIASDIAARGLDIKNVTHIINLDVPDDPKAYIHRAGRTGRADKAGTTLSIVTKREHATIKRYEKKLGIHVAAKELYKGQLVPYRPTKTKPRQHPASKEGARRNRPIKKGKHKK